MILTDTQRQILAIVDAEGPRTLADLKRWSTSSSSRGTHGMTQAVHALVRKGYLVMMPGFPVTYRRRGVSDPGPS